MENKTELFTSEVKPIRLSGKEELKCFKEIRSLIIKLLYMIEEEREKQTDISLFFYGCVFEIASSNTLCNGKLTKVLIKIHGLYENDKYKKMSHAQIKRQIMESKGILDYLISVAEQNAKEQEIH